MCSLPGGPSAAQAEYPVLFATFLKSTGLCQVVSLPSPGAAVSKPSNFDAKKAPTKPHLLGILASHKKNKYGVVYLLDVSLVYLLETSKYMSCHFVVFLHRPPQPPRDGPMGLKSCLLSGSSRVKKSFTKRLLRPSAGSASSQFRPRDAGTGRR